MRKSLVLVAAVFATFGTQVALSDGAIGIKRPQLAESIGVKRPQLAESIGVKRPQFA